MSPDKALALAWTYCAPGRDKSQQFVRGFWPDVARVAMEMFAQQTPTPKLDFIPSRCVRGNWPEAPRRNKLGIDLSKMEINL